MNQQSIEPINASILEAAKALGVGRSTIYELLNNRKLQSVKIGTRRLVTTASIRAFAAELANGEG